MSDRVSILRKKYREDKDRTEWALLDSKGKRVLRWFGVEKPSEERVKKEEKRIQFFKNQNDRQPKILSNKSTIGIYYKLPPKHSQSRKKMG
jgi:hypothetical protein